jgi:NADPH:quinone reductase-like Zn-dependent oxidoreductase
MTSQSATQAATMQAIVQDRYGPADGLQLQTADQPIINDDEVLVEVRAAAVGINDWLVLRGLPYVARIGYGLRRPRHRIPGLDLAGRVEAVGSGVRRFRRGDAVFGWGNGAFAEYAAVQEDQLVAKPANLTVEQAAAVPTSGFAALQALRDTGRLQSGQQVLIIGASGAVGTLAVQLAKAFGAQVTGVCSTRSVDLVRSLGAEQVIDYTTGGITQGGRRYDLILDLAGNRPLPTLRRALAPKGTLVIVGGSGGRWFMGIGRTLRAALVSPLVGQRLRPFFSKPSRKDLLVLKELLEAGKVTPVIDRTYPLAAAALAVGHVGDRHTQGKTVITV